MRARRIAIPTTFTRPRLLPGAEVRRCAGETMGTSWRIAFVSAAALSIDVVSAAAQRRLDGVVAEMSPWETQSDIFRFSMSAAGTWFAAHEAFISVLTAALEIAEETGGAYDPACGALVDLWGFGPAPPRALPPTSAAIETAKARSDWRRLRMDRSGRTVFQPGGVQLDLCSIAKGFGVDQVGEALDALGVDAWLVEVGGELKTKGAKPGGEPWFVSLDEGGALQSGGGDLVLALCDCSVATSGVGVRSFEDDGRRYSHAIDPRTGYPVDHELASVTVLHKSAMIADACATAALVLGREEGLAYACSRGLAARFVASEGDEALTPAFEAMLS